MTTTSSQATVTVPNVGPVMYDQIMRPINPELCSDQVPHLKEQYKDESKGDRIKRLERYNKDFAQFDVAAAEYLKGLNTQKNVQRKQAMASAEIEEKIREAAQLQQLESQFS
ncbi:hypothetical protein A2881_03340 [Candidatus Peribacteria bacterium RIFCSPHIGHO2_01_FULL_55_13]|nr:MAG: hypothetical protein A2881_03340 [Candidatus Peribacteria bacterium RIFCSPHIGHO2_01_FULL_55_13]OGJ66502.1 MAG: hypothetical protein A3F36_02625 [Candidatus Peribacteria bacterium RIFCSPHIGHO2_12_FULL_55_11]